MKFAQWAGWIVAAIFIFLYFKSCNTPPGPATTTKGDSVLSKALAESKQKDSIAQTYFQFYTYWRNKYDSLHNLSLVKEVQIIQSANKIKSLIDSNKYYRAVNDTLSQLRTCGDLISQDSILINLLFAAKVELDSTHAAHVQEQDAADSTIYYLRKEVEGLKAALLQLHTEYVDAVAETNVYIKKAKTASLWVKIFAVTTAIFGTKSIIK